MTVPDRSRRGDAKRAATALPAWTGSASLARNLWLATGKCAELSHQLEFRTDSRRLSYGFVPDPTAEKGLALRCMPFPPYSFESRKRTVRENRELKTRFQESEMSGE